VGWCGDEDTDEKWAFRRARSSTGKSAEDMIAGWNTTAIDSFSCPYTFVGDEDKLMHGGRNRSLGRISDPEIDVTSRDPRSNVRDLI